MKSETVLKMVEDRIRALGHDGLYNDECSCACTLDDLAPCGSMHEYCTSGIRVDGCNDECGNGCDFHIDDAGGEKCS